jgi:hypothetical protein
VCGVFGMERSVSFPDCVIGERRRVKMTDSKRGKHNPYLYPGLTSQAGQFPYCLPSHHIPTTQYILVPRP